MGRFPKPLDHLGRLTVLPTGSALALEGDMSNAGRMVIYQLTRSSCNIKGCQYINSNSLSNHLITAPQQTTNSRRYKKSVPHRGDISLTALWDHQEFDMLATRSYKPLDHWDGFHNPLTIGTVYRSTYSLCPSL